MSTLRNARYEAFSQALAAGKTAGKAYELAGFAPSYANASRLQRQDSIRRRVEEILDLKQRATDRAVTNAAERAGVDQFWVMRGLRRNATLAARRGDTAASNRATELIGKHLGMFIDKKQIEISYIDDADEYLQRILEIVNSRTVDHEPALLPAASDGLNDGSNSHAQDDIIDIIDETG
jgi:hypothetical protein